MQVTSCHSVPGTLSRWGVSSVGGKRCGAVHEVQSGGLTLRTALPLPRYNDGQTWQPAGVDVLPPYHPPRPTCRGRDGHGRRRRGHPFAKSWGSGIRRLLRQRVVVIHDTGRGGVRRPCSCSLALPLLVVFLRDRRVPCWQTSSWQEVGTGAETRDILVQGQDAALFKVCACYQLLPTEHHSRSLPIPPPQPD